MRVNLKAGYEKGFTLIELLIVVVILGVLAAVIVPQLAGSTSDAEDSAVDANLAALRSAIALYQQEHGVYPGVNTAVGSSCPTGSTAGTGTANTNIAFAEQLTMYTDANGEACSIGDATYAYGPYLKSATFGVNAIPENPRSATPASSRAVVLSTAGNLALASDGTNGWKYDNVTGQVIAND